MHAALDEITAWIIALLAFGIAGYLLSSAKRRIGHYVIACILLVMAFFLIIAVTSVRVRNQLHLARYEPLSSSHQQLKRVRSLIFLKFRNALQDAQRLLHPRRPD